MIEAIIYLLAVTIAEVITIFIQPLWGIVCHAVILAALIVHSAVVDKHLSRQLLLSLALVPLVRIISLSVPLAGIPQLLLYPIVYVPLLVSALVVVRILGYGRNEVGLNFKLPPVQLGVVLSGLLFGWLEYQILRPEAMVAQFTWLEVLPMALILLVFTGFAEEFIFRGVLQRSAVEMFGGWRGIIYISLLFAVLHLIHYPAVGLGRILMDITFVFVVAIFFGWAVKKTGSLFGVTLAHGITNIVLFLIAPFFL